MPHATLLDTLAAAELAFAHFNAHRTSAAEGAAIDLGGSPHWRWLADASRPASAYYSRAIARHAGTPFPPARRAAKQRYYCSDAFQFFIATEPTGAVLGWSTLFLDGGTAFLGNAFTRPQARGRGVHAALLAARLNAAAQAGGERVFTDVEHGSQSQANCERLGLRTVTLNTLWLRQA